MKKILVLLGMILLAACAPRVTMPPMPETARMAVAAPVLPQADWELLAGVLPQEKIVLRAEDRAALTQILLDEAAKRPRPVIAPQVVAGCAEQVLAQTTEGRRLDAVRYWQEVGRCAEADFVLVPFVLFWEDRIGGEWGVERPAHVILDLYVVETASGAVRRFHYEEEQRGLVENLFLAGKFARRQGRWLSAVELAREAVAQGFRELGL
jgi:hypothetical protein